MSEEAKVEDVYINHSAEARITDRGCEFPVIVHSRVVLPSMCDWGDDCDSYYDILVFPIILHNLRFLSYIVTI